MWPFSALMKFLKYGHRFLSLEQPGIYMFYTPSMSSIWPNIIQWDFFEQYYWKKQQFVPSEYIKHDPSWILQFVYNY